MTATAPTTAIPAGVASPLTPTLAWLVERAGVDDDARAAVREVAPAALEPGATDPAAVARALVAAGRPGDALRLVACALPPREGVWWAWIAARHAVQSAQARADAAEVGRPEPPSPGQRAAIAALGATEQWIGQPIEAHRRAAWDAAQAAGLDTPAGCVAAAAFLTGGSVTPSDGPPVPPPPGIHAVIAASATMLASVATDAGRLSELVAAFVEQGVAVVHRLGGWDAAVAIARRTYDAQARQHADAARPPQPQATA